MCTKWSHAKESKNKLPNSTHIFSLMVLPSNFLKVVEKRHQIPERDTIKEVSVFNAEYIFVQGGQLSMTVE